MLDLLRYASRECCHFAALRKRTFDCTVALVLRSRRDERIIASELSAAVKKEHSRCRENDYRRPRRRNERIGRFHYDRHCKRVAD